MTGPPPFESTQRWSLVRSWAQPAGAKEAGGGCCAMRTKTTLRPSSRADISAGDALRAHQGTHRTQRVKATREKSGLHASAADARFRRGGVVVTGVTGHRDPRPFAARDAHRVSGPATTVVVACYYPSRAPPPVHLDAARASLDSASGYML
eukprot:SAG11_NODE_824_length_6993_cov_1.875290_1_plen_150_part_10